MKKNGTKKKLPFYPGSLWGKRIFKLILLSSIGINLFINEIQDALYISGERMIELSFQLSQPANDVADLIEENVIPVIEYIQSSWVGRKLISRGGLTLPDTEYLKDGVQTTRQFKALLDVYGPVYKEASIILRIMSWLFWIPIGLAALWILFDIFKSKAWKFDLVLLAFAAWFNFFSYQWLMSPI